MYTCIHVYMYIYIYICIYTWQYAFNARLGLVGKWTNRRWVSEFTFEAQLRLLAELLQEMAASKRIVSGPAFGQAAPAT